MVLFASSVAREIKDRAHEKSLPLFHVVLAAINLQAQERLLNEVVGVIRVASATSKQPSELEE
jgi:hypothetical protein